jgi:hypothetical protein
LGHQSRFDVPPPVVALPEVSVIGHLAFSLFLSVMFFSCAGRVAIAVRGAGFRAFRRTSGADAADLDVRGEDAAESPGGGRDAKGVEVVALEVAGPSAAGADVMMVVSEVGVESDAFAARAECRDEPQLVEHPERPVDGIERHGRHPGLNRAEDGFGVRVLEARRDLAVDLEALVRQLEACPLRGPAKLFDPAVDLGAFDFHK